MPTNLQKRIEMLEGQQNHIATSLQQHAAVINNQAALINEQEIQIKASHNAILRAADALEVVADQLVDVLTPDQAIVFRETVMQMMGEREAPQDVCEHGKKLNDYCQPCGRIHGSD